MSKQAAHAKKKAGKKNDLRVEREPSANRGFDRAVIYKQAFSTAKELGLDDEKARESATLMAQAVGG